MMETQIPTVPDDLTTVEKELLKAVEEFHITILSNTKSLGAVLIQHRKVITQLKVIVYTLVASVIILGGLLIGKGIL